MYAVWLSVRLQLVLQITMLKKLFECEPLLIRDEYTSCYSWNIERTYMIDQNISFNKYKQMVLQFVCENFPCGICDGGRLIHWCLFVRTHDSISISHTVAPLNWLNKPSTFWQQKGEENIQVIILINLHNSCAKEFSYLSYFVYFVYFKKETCIHDDFKVQFYSHFPDNVINSQSNTKLTK